MSDSAQTAVPLSLPHRLAIVYLVLPVVVWLLGWFAWWLGVPLAALTVGGVWRLLWGPWRPGRPGLVACVLLIIALLWVMVSPAGGYFGWSVTDWITHRAVFLDLAGRPWPVHLAGYLDEDPPLLRYYTAWYVVPSLLAKLGGPAVLNWAVPLWTWCGVGLLVLLFARRLPLRQAVVAALILLLFSGLDVLEMLLHDGPRDAAAKLYGGFGGGSLDWHYDWGPSRLAYLSLMECLLWGPQHFIAAGLGTLLLLQCSREPRFLAAGGVVLACALLWSPLVAMGLGVLAAGLIVYNGVRPLLRWENLGVAPPLVAVFALYLSSGTMAVSQGWVWQWYESTTRLAAAMSFSYVAEFGLLALLLWWAKRNVLRNPFFLAALATLLALYWFHLGTARINDLSMRAGLPANIVLAYYAARVVAVKLPLRRGKRTLGIRQLPAGMVAAALLAGSLGAISELVTRMRDSRWLPYERGDWSLVVDRGALVWARYFSYEPPGLLRLLLRDAEDVDQFQRGELLIDGEHRVYRKGERLIFVGPTCDAAGEYFARAYREDAQGLPQAAPPLEVSAAFAQKRDGHCVVAARLPPSATESARI